MCHCVFWGGRIDSCSKLVISADGLLISCKLSFNDNKLLSFELEALNENKLRLYEGINLGSSVGLSERSKDGKIYGSIYVISLVIEDRTVMGSSDGSAYVLKLGIY